MVSTLVFHFIGACDECIDDVHIGSTNEMKYEIENASKDWDLGDSFIPVSACNVCLAMFCQRLNQSVQKK